MIVFVTVSNALYEKARKYNGYMAAKCGKFDKIVLYDISEIDEDFKKKHFDVLSTSMGAGLWLWKPYFINKAINEECREDDYLFYLDAAAFFVRDVRELIRSVDDDIFATLLPYLEEEFTKAETFEALQVNNDEFKKTSQFQASFMMFKKNRRSVNFISEWLRYACELNIISPTINCGIQIPTYKGHKMDQSIFSLLCKKFSVTPYQDISQYRYIGYPYMKGVQYVDIQDTFYKEAPFCVLLHRRKSITFFSFIFFLLKDAIIAMNNKFFSLFARRK